MDQTSQVFKWGHPRLNIQDPQKRFLKSEWNYFLIDQEAGVLAGYWHAEEGQEILGNDEFVEILHIIEGNLLVQSRDFEGVARSGDTVVIHKKVVTKLVVEDPIRAFFICYAVSDPIGYAEAVTNLCQQSHG